MGIGSILVERGLIDSSQLDEAIEEQKRTGERLDRVMVRMGLIDDNKVLEAIGTHFQMPIIDLEQVEVDAAATLGADSLSYLPVEEMDRVFQTSRCAACFDGSYPQELNSAERAQIASDRRCAQKSEPS